MITPRERPTESSLKMDYARPLAEHLHVSAGYLGSLEQFHTTLDTRLFSAPSNDFIVDPARTNRFTFDQTVHAVYGILTGANGKIRYQGGVRAENAGTRFRRAFSALSSAPATAFDNHYNSVFPSGLIAYDVDESEYFKLSYSTRIRRPEDTDQLDPTPQYQDPLNISRGNPSLKPEYIRAIELGFQKTTTNTTLQITPYLRHTIDAVRRIRTIDSAGVTTTTFANIATTDNYGADATLALHGGKLTGFVGSSAFRQVSNASNISSTLSAKTFGWTARANASLRVSKTFDMQTIVSYRGKTTVEQGTNGAQTRVSFAARQKLRNDRVSLTLRVTDPFGTERERSTVIDPKFTVSSERWRKVRGVLLNVTWNFGRPQKEKSLDQLEPPG